MSEDPLEDLRNRLTGVRDKLLAELAVTDPIESQWLGVLADIRQVLQLLDELRSG